MSGFLARWNDRFRPFGVGAPEMFLFRLGLALVVWHLFPMQTYADQPVPNGLARLGLDFTWLHNPEHLEVAQWVLLGGLVLFVLDRFSTLGLAAVFALLTAAGSLTNSQSNEVTHHSQIVTLTVLALLLGHLWHMVNPPAGKKRGPARIARQRTAFWLALQMICAAYMVSVVSKMVHSDGKWMINSANMPVQLEKNRLADSYNHIGLPEELLDEDEKPPTGFAAQLPLRTRDLFIDHPQVARIILSSGLLLEAFCFLGLLGRLHALVVGVMLIAFHLTISLVMSLTFEYNIAILLLTFVGIPHWLTCWLPWGRPPREPSTDP